MRTLVLTRDDLVAGAQRKPLQDVKLHDLTRTNYLASMSYDVVEVREGDAKAVIKDRFGEER